jgi:dGTPase
MTSNPPSNIALDLSAHQRWSRGSSELTRDTIRSPTEHDHDRVLYSAAFRRLGDVTQTSSGNPTAYLHNRLTHSLRVEHMGDAIAKVIRSRPPHVFLDVPAIKAACLAHDLGHPPFGHIGERMLNELVRCPAHRKPTLPEQRIPHYDGHIGSSVIHCKKCLLADGFEGNAQTFRIVTLLETQRVKPGSGLNWTRLSMAAVNKYPWLLGGNPAKPNKWGAYDCDLPALQFALPTGRKDLHAEIMDWADDIAYAVHDIEDYFRVHMVPLHSYHMGEGDGPLRPSGENPGSEEQGKAKNRVREVDRFFQYVERKLGVRGKEMIDLAEPALQGIFAIFPEREFRGGTSDLEAVDNLRAGLIRYFLDQTQYTDAGGFFVPDEVIAVNSLLKELTWFHVIDNPELILVQQGQQKLLERLFLRLCDLVLPDVPKLHELLTAPEQKEDALLRRLPSRLYRYLYLGWNFNVNYDQDQSAYRAILDYISSLGDSEAYMVDAMLLGAKEYSHVGAAGFHA